ncbi:MAG: peptide deformylase [Desulfuromonas sp.]
MALRRILHYPEPILTQVSAPVKYIDEHLISVVADMVDTMYAAPGVGLAAPQIGVLKRVVIIDCGSKEEPDLIKAVNPQIVDSAGECSEEEGCLSVPDYYACVKRKSWVKVRYQDMLGKWIEQECEGLLAIAFQHEIDHLDGKLFVDRLSSLKKGIFKKKYKQIKEQQGEQL